MKLTDVKIIVKKSDEQKDLAEILAKAITGGDYEAYISDLSRV